MSEPRPDTDEPIIEQRMPGGDTPSEDLPARQPEPQTDDAPGEDSGWEDRAPTDEPHDMDDTDADEQRGKDDGLVD